MPAALTSRQESAKAALDVSSKNWKRDRDAAKKSRATLDTQIRRAVKAGMSYRQVAAEVGMSVAWVQVSLDRTDPDKT